jgi:hypothetical protein
VNVHFACKRGADATVSPRIPAARRKYFVSQRDVGAREKIRRHRFSNSREQVRGGWRSALLHRAILRLQYDARIGAAFPPRAPNVLRVKSAGAANAGAHGAGAHSFCARRFPPRRWFRCALRQDTDFIGARIGGSSPGSLLAN